MYLHIHISWWLVGFYIPQLWTTCAMSSPGGGGCSCSCCSWGARSLGRGCRSGAEGKVGYGSSMVSVGDLAMENWCMKTYIQDNEAFSQVSWRVEDSRLHTMLLIAQKDSSVLEYVFCHEGAQDNRIQWGLQYRGDRNFNGLCPVLFRYRGHYSLALELFFASVTDVVYSFCTNIDFLTWLDIGNYLHANSLSVFPQLGDPQNVWFIMENPIKIYSHLWKPTFVLNGLRQLEADALLSSCVDLRQASDLALSLAIAGCEDGEIFDARFKCLRGQSATSHQFTRHIIDQLKREVPCSSHPEVGEQSGHHGCIWTQKEYL